MRLTLRDGIATALVAAIVVPFVFYITTGSATQFVQDATGMAGVALILGVAAALIGGWLHFFRQGTAEMFEWLFAVAAAGLGVVALISENRWFDATIRDGLLGGAVVMIAVLWAIATLQHAGAFSRHTPSASQRA